MGWPGQCWPATSDNPAGRERDNGCRNYHPTRKLEKGLGSRNKSITRLQRDPPSRISARGRSLTDHRRLADDPVVEVLRVRGQPNAPGGDQKYREAFRARMLDGPDEPALFT